MNDYQLEEMENSQIKKASTAKKAAILAAGGLGLTATGAFAADRIGAMTNDENSDEVLTEDDLINGANAASLDEAATDTAAPATTPAPTPAPAPTPVDPVPNVEVGESGIAFDEDGNIIGQYDSGTVDGDLYVVMDTDLNGKGDLLALDTNHNGQIDDNEVLALDNKSYTMGEPQKLVIIDTNESDYPGPHVPVEPGLADINDIHNDFFDDTTGDTYRHDLADSNPDYNNDARTDYYAGFGEKEQEADPFDPDAEYDPLADYEPDVHNDDLADNDTFDDAGSDDAFMC